MDQNENEVALIRERTIITRALMQQLADIALSAPPPLAKRLETIAAMGFECVQRNLDALTHMLDRSSFPLRAA